MPYDPNEVARPRSLMGRMADKSTAYNAARYVITAPTAIAEMGAGIAGMVAGGYNMLANSAGKALRINNFDKSYEDIADESRALESRPTEWVKENLPFGQEADEAIQDSIGQIFTYLNNKGEEYGQKNLEATGSPLWAAAAETSFKILPYLGAEALGVRAAKGAHGVVRDIRTMGDLVDAKAIGQSLATPKPAPTPVIPPTRFLNSQHLDLPETSINDVGAVTKENFAERIKSSFGISDEHANAVQAAVEARAKQWANETGYLPQDYYPQYFQEITKGGESGPGALFQRDPEYAATWYSHLEKTVEGSKFPNKAPGADMAKALESWARKGDIKPEELAWTGTAEWLRKQKGTVTKQQVLDHIKRNSVEIVEKTRRELDSDEYSNIMQDINDYNDTMSQKYDARGGNRWQHYATEDELATYF